MEATALRALQAPLKEGYRQDPASARIVLHAEGDTTENISCRVKSWNNFTIESGLHPATGGDGSFACSGDMLLQALVACAGVTLRSVATAMGVQLRSARVVADGTIDFRGTLAVSKEVAVGFEHIRLSFVLDTDSDTTTVERLINLTERYCVVFQTLRQPPQFEVSVVNERPS